MSFETRAKNKIIGLRASKESIAIDKRAEAAVERDVLLEQMNSPERVLAKSVEDFRSLVEQRYHKEFTKKNRLWRRMLGRTAIKETVKRTCELDVEELNLRVEADRVVAKALERKFRLTRQFTGSWPREPGGLVINLWTFNTSPYLRDVSDPDLDLEYCWKIESSHPSGSPHSTSKINIYKLASDALSGEETDEKVYEVITRKPEGMDFAIADVISFTDGARDDKFISLSKDSQNHALAIINTAIAELKD